jgi:nucleotide-binding universal stress UspA family protein
MIKRMIVPLDGSPFAEWALPTAIALALRARGEIRLVRVAESPYRFGFSRDSGSERLRAEEYLAEVTERVRAHWPGPISTAVREGPVAAQLEAEAAEWRADLFVMSTHGRSGVSRLWMGSVAARCVESGVCPVLVVRPPALGSPDLSRAPWVGRVVVPLDGSVSAERALEPAASLARVFGVHAVLLRILPEGGAAASADSAAPANARATAGAPSLSQGSGRSRERSEARVYVERQVARFRRAGIHTYGMLLNEPEPAESIADRVTGDLVVMATRGHGRSSRTLFGTVTDRVVRDATYPVLVIPPERGALERARAPRTGPLAALRN